MEASNTLIAVACRARRAQGSEMAKATAVAPPALDVLCRDQRGVVVDPKQQRHQQPALHGGHDLIGMPSDAASNNDDCTADSIMIVQLSRANTELRQALEAAGLHPEPPLPSEPQNLHLQHGLSISEEQVAALAEENYQLRQLMQQLQLQQRLQQLQEQQEQELLAGLGDPLQLDRFNDCMSPVTLEATQKLIAVAPGHRRSVSYGAAEGRLAEGRLAVSSLYRSALPLSPTSPAVVAAGILFPPSASAVQLAEAEAAAQIATQAAIQAEAAAVCDLAWQQQQQHDASVLQQQWQSCGPQHQDAQQQQQQWGETRSDTSSSLSASLTADAVAALTAAAAAAAHDGRNDNTGSIELGPLKLPQLVLPSKTLRRYALSESPGLASRAGSDIAPSVGSNFTDRSNVTSVSNRSADDPWSGRCGSFGTGSSRSVASNDSGGLKQVVHNLRLASPSSRSQEGTATSAVLNTAARSSSNEEQLTAAAHTAALAAAEYWVPHRGVASAATDAGNREVFNRDSSHCVHSCGASAASAGSNSIALTAQPTELLGAGELRLRSIRVSTAVQLSPQRSAVAAPAGAAAAAQAGVAAAAFALQQQQQDRSSALPPLPRLKVLNSRGSTAASQQQVQQQQPAAATAAAAADAVSDNSSACGSPCSDSAFFRDSACEEGADTAFADVAYAAAALASQLDSYTTSSGVQFSRRHSSEYGGRMSSDFFGARISMDGSASVMPRVSLTGCGGSVLQLFDDQMGWCDDQNTETSEQSEWLGISYQPPGQAQNYSNSNFAQPVPDSCSYSSTRQSTQQQQQDCGGSSMSSFARNLRQQQQFIKQGGMAPPSIPENYFFDSMASYCSEGGEGMYDQGLRHDSSNPSQGMTHHLHAAMSHYHGQAPGGCQWSGTASADRSGASFSEQNSVVTVTAGVAGSTEKAAAAAAAAAAGVQEQRNVALGLPDLSTLAVQQAQRTQQLTPVLRTNSALSYVDPQTAYSLVERSHDSSSNGLAGLQVGFAAAAGAIEAAATNSGGGVSSEQLRKLLTDLAVAQQSSAAATTVAVAAAAAAPVSPFAAAAGSTAADRQLPRLTVQTTSSAVQQPVAIPEQQQQQQQQRASSGSSYGAAAQLPPRSGMRSSNSIGNLLALQLSLNTAGSAAAVPPLSPAAAAAGGGAMIVSPRINTIHSRLRVVTTAARPQSTGSNSDGDTTSATTTPVHAHLNVLRSSSSSSLLRAVAAAAANGGGGLCSITVPPSPASSGVRYVPASPRVVGFDCPTTPQAQYSMALRSPSWRSEAGGDSTHPNTPGAAATAAVYINNSSSNFTGNCSSGCSTPRRTPTSPGLLHQALVKQGHAGGSGSGSSTPCGNRRAAAVAAAPMVSCNHSGFAAAVSAGGLHGSSSISLHVQGSGSSTLTSCNGQHLRSNGSGTLMLTHQPSGQMPQQQQQHVSGCHIHPVCMQQPLPLPLQQQQHMQSELQASWQAAAAQRCGGTAVNSRTTSMALEHAGSAVLEAVMTAAAAATADGIDASAPKHVQQQQRQQEDCVNSLEPIGAAVAKATQSVQQPLIRSVSPVQQLQQRSSSSGSSMKDRATSPVKGTAEQWCHTTKLSRFGLAAAKAGNVAAAAAPASLARLGCGCSDSKDTALLTIQVAPTVASPTADGAAVQKVCCTTADVLSNASSVAAPDTPAVADAAAGSSSSSANVTPTAADAAAAAAVVDTATAALQERAGAGSKVVAAAALHFAMQPHHTHSSRSMDDASNAQCNESDKVTCAGVTSPPTPLRSNGSVGSGQHNSVD